MGATSYGNYQIQKNVVFNTEDFGCFENIQYFLKSEFDGILDFDWQNTFVEQNNRNRNKVEVGRILFEKEYNHFTFGMDAVFFLQENYNIGDEYQLELIFIPNVDGYEMNFDNHQMNNSAWYDYGGSDIEDFDINTASTDVEYRYYYYNRLCYNQLDKWCKEVYKKTDIILKKLSE